MKRLAVLGLVVLVVMAAAIPAALAHGGGPGNNGWGKAAPSVPVELTEEQKAELENIYDQMWELRKQLLSKQVELGLIPEQEADLVTKQLDFMKEYYPQYGLEYGSFCPGGMMGAFGPGGMGMMGGPGGHHSMMGGYGPGSMMGW